MILAIVAAILPGVLVSSPERNPPNPLTKIPFINSHSLLRIPPQSIDSSIFATFSPNSSHLVSFTIFINKSRSFITASLIVVPTSSQPKVEKNVFRESTILFPKESQSISSIKLWISFIIPVIAVASVQANSDRSISWIMFVSDLPIFAPSVPNVIPSTKLLAKCMNPWIIFPSAVPRFSISILLMAFISPEANDFPIFFHVSNFSIRFANPRRNLITVLRPSANVRPNLSHFISSNIP